MDELGYTGYPPSSKWNKDSRVLSEATNTLRSFVVNNIVQDNEWEIDRITKYYLFWKFYEGKHFKDFNDGMLSFNYVRAFIDKVSMFLLGDKGFTFKVRSYYSSIIPSEVEKQAEELFMYHWNKSRGTLLGYEMLQMGSVSGDLWCEVAYQVEEKYCKVSVLDSRHCFPMFTNGDHNKLESFLVRQQLSPDNKYGYKLFVTKYTKDKIETWYQTTTTLGDKGVVKMQAEEMENPYGVIPIVHIKNKPTSTGYFSVSDANDILKINKVYNEINLQVKSIIDYHTAPTTVITGGTAKNLKRGLGQIWSGLPPEANVFNLGLDVDITGATNFAQQLKTAMHELSDVPENALGKLQSIGNTSAEAIQMTYLPLIQQAKIKAGTYGEGIEEINNIIIKILQVMEPENKRLQALLEFNEDFLTECEVSPVFDMGLPKDALNELNKAQMELGMKITSRREVMNKLGKENVPALLEEIDEDIIEQRLLEMELQALGGDTNVDEEPEENTPEEEPEEDFNEGDFNTAE